MQEQQRNLPTNLFLPHKSVPKEEKAVVLAPWLVIHGIHPTAKPEKGKGEQAGSEITGGIIQLIASAILCSEYQVKWACEC